MFDASWIKVRAEIDTASVFKKNMIILNFDGCEDHLASQNLLSLVGDKMFWFREEILLFDLPKSIEALNNAMEPPAGVRRYWCVNTTILILILKPCCDLSQYLKTWCNLEYLFWNSKYNGRF